MKNQDGPGFLDLIGGECGQSIGPESSFHDETYSFQNINTNKTTSKQIGLIDRKINTVRVEVKVPWAITWKGNLTLPFELSLVSHGEDLSIAIKV